MAHCSHLCLIIPKGHRCSCPEGSTLPSSITGHCSSGFENAKAEPYKCPCKNGGYCNNDKICNCPTNFEGNYCEDHIPRSRITGGPLTFANTILPLLLVIIALLLASGLFLYFKKRNL